MTQGFKPLQVKFDSGIIGADAKPDPTPVLQPA